MSLTVQQLLSDAKRLSSRLRDHDQSADHLISRAQEVLKEVDAMRQYQEDVENLNEVAHNRPRAQLVLGIQQENRHIRTLQQENKELRAALEEHQNALELIMSKYRQHVTRLVNTPHPDINTINNQKIQMLADRTEKVCEMAAVMKEAVRVDEDTCNQQQELMARLITENKGLRELLEISQKSNSSPRVRKVVSNVHKEVQTDHVSTVVEQVVSVTLPMPTQPRPPPRSPKIEKEKKQVKVEPIEPVEPVEQMDILECGVGELSSGDSDETGSEDESVKYDTIKLADRRNKVAVKEKVISTETVKVEEIRTDEQTEVKLENKPATVRSEDIVVESKSIAKDNVVAGETPSISKDTNSCEFKIEPVKPSIDNASTDDPVIPVQDAPSPSPPKPVLTEGQQNLVLVDSLVEQLVRDSVETSDDASSNMTTTKTDTTSVSDTSTTLAASEPSLDIKPTTEPVTAASEPSKPNPDKGKAEQEAASPPTSTPSSQQSAKSVTNTKAESSPSRSNSKGKNKKNADNKGNKNSPKKGNKK